MITDVIKDKLYIFCEGPHKEDERRKMYKFLQILNKGNNVLDVGILQIQSDDQVLKDSNIADRIGISLEVIDYGDNGRG